MIVQGNDIDAAHGTEQTTQHPRTVLLVDDKDDSRILLKWFLESFGFVVQPARGAAQALRMFNDKLHDVVLTDNSMPGMSGSEMAHVIKLRSPTTPVLMYTGEKPEDTSCLDVVILKPSHLLVLKEALDKLFTEKAPPPAD